MEISKFRKVIRESFKLCLLLQTDLIRFLLDSVINNPINFQILFIFDCKFFVSISSIVQVSEMEERKFIVPRRSEIFDGWDQRSTPWQSTDVGEKSGSQAGDEWFCAYVSP